jgi:hypothetical protein
MISGDSVILLFMLEVNQIHLRMLIHAGEHVLVVAQGLGLMTDM